MKARILSIAILSASLVACGGGGGGGGSTPPPTNPDTPANPDTPDPAQPMLEIKGITGINYTIGDRNGVVEAGKAIEYVSGEDVTFSLGKLAIATVAAKDEITMADMFPALPESAKDFRAALRQHYHVAAELQTSPETEKMFKYGAEPALHRLSNIMQLLIAMDSDADASNGLDLTTGGWASKLADTDLNALPLNSHLESFSSNVRVRAFSHKYELPLSMDIATPLSTLYQMIGKSLSVKPVTGYTTPNISPGSTVSYTFFRDRLVEEKRETSNGIFTDKYIYDTRGNMTREISETDTNSDGNRDQHRNKTYSYNDYGVRLKSGDERFNDSSQPANYHYTNTGVADKALLQQTRTNNELQADQYFEVGYGYTDAHLLREAITRGYDSDGNEVGVVAGRTYKYSDGLLAVAEKGLYAATQYNGKEQLTYTYANQQVSASYAHFDSNNDQTRLTYVLTDQFDDKDRLVGKNIDIKSGGVTILKRSAVYKYDEQGRLISCTSTEDDGGDGIFEYQSRMRKVYDENGLTETLLETDEDGDGNFTPGERLVITYGDDGALTSESDNNGAQYTYADEAIENGVTYMVHELMLIDDELNNNECSLSTSERLSFKR